MNEKYKCLIIVEVPFCSFWYFLDSLAKFFYIFKKEILKTFFWQFLG